MLYLADLLQKEVICGDEHCKSATIHYNNLTRQCVLKVGEQMFEPNKISFGDNICVTDDDTATLQQDDSTALHPFGEISVGQRVYDVNGKFLGELENAEFTSKLVLKKLWVQDTEFKRGQIFSVGDAVIIRAKTPKQILAQQARELRKMESEADSKAEKHAESGQTVGLHNNAPTVSAAAQLVAMPEGAFNKRAAAAQIRRRYGNFNFLLGKTADKTIVNFQGEVMIKKSEKVTKEVLRQAKISGKLIELYLHVE